ncbi:MAG: mechanosensitive ion channel [Candidatus Peribacteria bacterium]|nr:MAG: mechanosensitive ion channel [Candidatus Peribacteria bacterium]
MEINVLTTTILTLDQNHVFVPNGPIINANILNYSKKNIMRVDVQVGIAYQESIDQAREVLLAMAFSQPGILSDPAPKVYVNSL